MSVVAGAGLNIVLGVLLGVLGLWGVRNASDTVPATLPEHDRLRRERVLRRGAVACGLIGVVFVAMGVFGAFG